MISDFVKDHVRKTCYGYTLSGDCTLVATNQCCWCGEVDDPESTRNWPSDEDGDRICYACQEHNDGAVGEHLFMFGVFDRAAILRHEKPTAKARVVFRAPDFEHALDAGLRAALRLCSDACFGTTRLAIYPLGITEDVVWMWLPMATG